MSLKWGYSRVLIPLALLGGILIGLILPLRGWEIKREIDLLHAASILASIFIVVYITRRLERLRDTTKVKKEILVKQTDQLVGLIRDVKNQVETASVSIADAPPAFKDIYTRFESLCYFVNRVSRPNTGFEERFKTAHREARRLATSTPPKASSKRQDIRVEGGRIVYSSAQTGRIRGSLLEMERAIIDEQIRLIDA